MSAGIGPPDTLGNSGKDNGWVNWFLWFLFGLYSWFIHFVTHSLLLFSICSTSGSHFLGQAEQEKQGPMGVVVVSSWLSEHSSFCTCVCVSVSLCESWSWRSLIAQLITAWFPVPSEPLIINWSITFDERASYVCQVIWCVSVRPNLDRSSRHIPHKIFQRLKVAPNIVPVCLTLKNRTKMVQAAGYALLSVLHTTSWYANTNWYYIVAEF